MDAISRKQARLKALWSRRLGNPMVILPLSGQVFREIRRELRQAGLA